MAALQILQEKLNTILDAIQPGDQKAGADCTNYLNQLAKPLKSLGRMESLAIQLAAITGATKNRFDKKAILVFCADNGVVEENISFNPYTVTREVAENFSRDKTCCSILSNMAHAEVAVIDVGIRCESPIPGVLNKKINMGTKNAAKGPAMTREECLQGIVTGIETVAALRQKGYCLLGTGEMGVGNTTTSSAIISVLSGKLPEDTTGYGAGLPEAMYRHKINTVKKMIQVNRPNPKDPIDVLAKIGGFDLCALSGVFLGGAYYKIPVVIDGLISIAACLCAVQLNPRVRDYVIASHVSREKGYGVAADMLGIEGYFQLDMSLGEGSGCPFTFHLIDNCMEIIHKMATFDQSNLEKRHYYISKDRMDTV